MTEILCSWCLCLAIAMQTGGKCHKCNNGTQKEFLKVAQELREPEEFIAASCYEKGKKPEIDFMSKQGPIIK